MKDREKNLCERKQQSVYIFLFLLCLTGFTAGILAQYSVKSSDTLWDIADRNTQPKIAWQRIYDANAFLQQPGRRFEDGNGRTIVVIHEGEILQGVNSEGLVPTTPTPTSTPSPSPSPSQTPIPPPDVVGFWESVPNWFWWFLAIIAILIGLTLLGRWLYSRDGVSWRPVHRGGVSDGVANMRFNEWARTRYATLIGGSAEKVRLYGVWNTRHRGFPITVPHRYEGVRAYRARFRMPNGAEQVGYMLQGCGNDVSSGAWYIPSPDARFEEGWGDENSNQNSATSASESAQPAGDTSDNDSDVAASTVAEEEKVEDGVVRFELRKATDDNPAMVRLRGVNEQGDNTVEIREGEITIRYTPKKGTGF